MIVEATIKEPLELAEEDTSCLAPWSTASKNYIRFERLLQGGESHAMPYSSTEISLQRAEAPKCLSSSRVIGRVDRPQRR